MSEGRGIGRVVRQGLAWLLLLQLVLPPWAQEARASADAAQEEAGRQLDRELSGLLESRVAETGVLESRVLETPDASTSSLEASAPSSAPRIAHAGPGPHALARLQALHALRALRALQALHARYALCPIHGASADRRRSHDRSSDRLLRSADRIQRLDETPFLDEEKWAWLDGGRSPFLTAKWLVLIEMGPRRRVGLSVEISAYLDEKLILAANAGELYEAPFSADLVAYHSPLTAQEQGSASPAAAGAILFRVSPSPKAAQVLLESGYDNIRLYPFPEQLERGLILGPAGGTVTSPDGVEISLPEGALASRTVVKGRLLTAQELAAYSGPAVAGYQLLAGVRVELTGATLARPATLRLPTPAGTPADASGDKRIVLTSWIGQPEDNRGAFPRLVSRGDRLASSGANPERLVFAPESDTSNLPLEGVIREGVYLVLRANASIGFATGFVKAANGFGYAAARVTTAGLGTADLSLPGGRYTSVVPAGASKVLTAKHPTLDEQGTATIATLAPEAVATVDITVTPVPPSITGVQPPDNATNQPLGSVVRAQFSEVLDPASVGVSSLRVQVAIAGGSGSGSGSGIFINGTVALSSDKTAIVFSPTRPLPLNTRLLCSFTGGARDAGGTPYSGALPYTWSFRTTDVAPTNSNIDPTKIRLLLPDPNGTAQIIGDPGAIPSGWGVSADIDGPVICPSITTVHANPQGAFTYTVGCPTSNPAVRVTLSSRVFLRVTDSQDSLAATLLLGPFTSEDGKGVVAVPGQVTRYTTSEGVGVEIPAGAFDEPTLVSIRKLDPASLDVPLTPGLGLQVGAYLSVDFVGKAKESVRVKVPVSTTAPVGRMVFVGEPMALSWGKRLRLIDLGRVVDGGGGQKLLSNHVADQPTLGGSSPSAPNATASSRSRRGQATLANVCPDPNNPCCPTSPPPGNPPQYPQCPDPANPSCPPCSQLAVSCPGSCSLVPTILAEFTSRASGAFVLSETIEMGAFVGSSQVAEAGIAFDVFYNKYADTFVYAAPPTDWKGQFILPFVPGVPFSVVRRDPATGWITGSKDYAALLASPTIVSVGEFEAPKDGPPVLVDGSPFAFTLFKALDVPTNASQRCTPLRLEAEACTLTGQTKVAPPTAPGAPKLAEESRVTLLDLQKLYDSPPAPPASSTSTVLANGTFSVSVPSSPGDQLLLVVAPGDVEPELTTKLELFFDRALAPASTLELRDCGPVTSGTSCTDFPIDVSLAQGDKALVAELKGVLARGHRFQLELVGVASATGSSPSYLGPTTFEFATRRSAELAVGQTGPLSLGDTDIARDLLRFGNLLLVASVTGNILAFDLSEPLVTTSTPISPVALRPRLHAAMGGVGEQIRAMATDGHERVFYVSGANSWAVKALRVEDARGAQPQALTSCGGAGQPPCCALPVWAGPPPSPAPLCFAPVVGGVKVSLALGAGTLLGSEYLAMAGGLPTGTPTKLDVAVEDDLEGEDELEDFYQTNKAQGAPSLAQLSPDSQGYYTFEIVLDSAKHPMPAVGGVDCLGAGQSPYKWQRATVENLTTGQSFSFDVPIPSFAWTTTPAPGPTLSAKGIRARRGDRLRVKYNVRALGYLAIVGGGITVVDLNRFYDVAMESVPAQGNKSQCGRRLTHYAGSDLSIASCNGLPSPDGLAYTTSVAAFGGASDIDVYSALRHYGPVHSGSVGQAGALDLKAQEILCVRGSLPPPTIVSFNDVALGTSMTWEGGPAAGGDLLFVTLGEGGVMTYDVSFRALGAPIGRFGLRPKETVFRLQLDRARGRLFAGGSDNSVSPPKPKIWVWDISRAAGQPPASGVDPRLLLTLDAPWDSGHLGIDDGTGLLYTWNNGTDPGARVYPVEDPKVLFMGRYLPQTLPSPRPTAGTAWPSVLKQAARFSPMGIPSRATADLEAIQTNREEDEQSLTAAFKVRMALPGALGDKLTAKVQTLRALPDSRSLSHEDLGPFVALNGGPGWPKRDVYVTLRRVAGDYLTSVDDPQGRNGRLGDTGSLYESEETVLLVADPRAKADYWKTRQRIGATQSAELADEDSQCRRCERPFYLPAPPSGAPTDVKELLAGGRYVRVFLDVDVSSLPSIQTDTDKAVQFFDVDNAQGRRDNYRAPAGVAELSAFADEVPSVSQIALAEPARSPAMLGTEAGGAISLTSGEGLLSQVDHAVPGRGLSFAFERSYRSGLLGYGPLGAAGWGSPLFAHVREMVLEGGASAEKETLVEYHDGDGQVFRFPAKDASGACPSGTEEDNLGSYCAPEGLYLRLQKLSGGKGWRLIGRNNDTALFDEKGLLTEVSDRFRQGEPDPAKQGSTLRLLRDPAGQLVEVEDDLGRSYAFLYHDDPADERFGLLKELSDFDSRKVAFTYDGSSTVSDRKLKEVELPQVQTASGPATPKLTYDYYSGPALSSAAPHHGDFSALRLAGFTQPTGTDHRLRFEYSGTGRVDRVSVPGSLNPSQRAVWQVLTPGLTTAAPASLVKVVQPFPHDIDYTLTSGRITDAAESAEALLDSDPTPPIGTVPATKTLQTIYNYLPDGRLDSVTFPDKSLSKLTYPGPTSAMYANRLQRLNVTDAEETLVNGGVAGTAGYSSSISKVLSFVDNMPQDIQDPLSRTITAGVATNPSQAGVLSEHAAAPKQTRVAQSADYDAFGRVKASLSGNPAIRGGTLSVDFSDDYRGTPSAGFPKKVTTGTGPSVMTRSFQYDNGTSSKRGNLTRVDTGYGTASTFKYDAWDRVVEETHGLGSGPYTTVQNDTVKRAYDASGRLVKVTREQDPIGPVETLFVYNERDQLSKRTDRKVAGSTIGAPLVDAVTEYFYDAFGRLDNVKSPEGVVTKYTYDSAGRVLTEQVGTSGTRRFAYDLEGRLVYATDGDQGVWRGRYDAWGRLYREDLPTGAVIQRTFDEAGGLTKQQTYSGDPGLATSQLLTETRTNVTSYGAVNEVEEVLSIGTGATKVTRKEYDEAGRLAKVTSGASAIQRTDLELSYDESNRVTVERDGGGNRTEYAYTGSASWPDQVRRYEAVPGLSPMLTTTSSFTRDALGRVTQENRGNGTVLITSYDQAGNVRTQQTSVGSLTQIDYDGQGKPTKVSKPTGNVSEYAYDLDGRLRFLRTNMGSGTNTTEYQYEPPTGRLAKLIRPDGTYEEFVYNPDDTLDEWRTRSGIKVKHVYDTANRLISRTPDAATALAGAPLTDSGDTFTYDTLSRLLTASRPLSPAQGVAFSGYDAVGRPASEVVGSRAPVLRQYDVWSRQTAIQLPSGVGHDPSSPFAGYQRGFDNLDRLVSLQSLDPSSTTIPVPDLGATWAWGGTGRLYGVTTNGALKTAHRYSYLGSGVGPQPGGSVTTPWRLGMVSVGAATSAATPVTNAPTQLWGQMGYGYRQGNGAKQGREVLTQTPTSPSLFAGQGFAYKVDNALRLTDALSGKGAMDGSFNPGPTSSAFTMGYGDGDEVLSISESPAATPPPPGTATLVTQESGDEGRITKRNAVPITYDPEGHRVEDDRFRYSWNWRSELVAIDVKPLWAGRNDGDPPIPSPYPDHQVRLERDALGRIYAKLHLGPRPLGATDDCTRPVLSKREYLWDGDTMLSEAGYGPSGPYCNQTPSPILWRKSYVPGSSGLDDAVQLRVEVYDAGGAQVVSDELYSYIRDEQGTVQSLVRETGPVNPSSPEVVVRYLYSPYGEAYAEVGPELRRATFDSNVLSLTRPDGTNASQAPGANAQGAFRFTLSVPLDPTTVTSGVLLEKLTGSAWGAVQAAQMAIGLGASPDELLVLPLDGWERGTSYRVKVTSSLRDTIGRAASSQPTLSFGVPQSAPVVYDVAFPALFENHVAASQSASGAFPGGQPHLWQGAYTCEVTGLQFKRARVYDPRSASWLSPDPLGDVDSPSVYAYVAGRPYVGVDPMGLCEICDRAYDLYQNPSITKYTKPFQAYVKGMGNVLISLPVLLKTVGGAYLYATTKDSRFAPEFDALQALLRSGAQDPLGFLAAGFTQPWGMIRKGFEQGNSEMMAEGLGSIITQLALLGYAAKAPPGATVQVPVPVPALATAGVRVATQAAAIPVPAGPGLAGLTLLAQASEASKTPKTDPRDLPGTAAGGENLPVVSGKWLRGSQGNAGLIPKQVADKLRGRTFSSWADFRAAFWKAVASIPELAAQFSPQNRGDMEAGFAPHVVEEQVSGKGSYTLHHRTPVWDGGGVYDLDNLIVVTPRYHDEVLAPSYHFNK